ncbi:hypothetical protein JL722_5099 [Aureococcus anophagefferens]|nr:hypothetical protein JL722_5099 [Aureococcus anophagefferens]
MLEKRPMRHLIARLASVGFFVNFQPSEPFLTWYLLRRKGELLAEASGGDRGALYGVLECAAGLGSCVGAALAPSAPRRPRLPAAVAAAVGALYALGALARHRRPSLLIANVVGRHVCFGFGFAAACAGIAAAAAPAAEADGAVVSPLRGDDDDDERPSDAPEPPRARCALIYGANTTLALAVAAALQWGLAARRAGAPAYFAAAAIQAGFAALALCVFR